MVADCLYTYAVSGAGKDRHFGVLSLHDSKVGGGLDIVGPERPHDIVPAPVRISLFGWRP